MHQIPILTARGNGLAEAWENSLLEVYYNGLSMKTQYDKSEDPPSKDCTMLMIVNDPFGEPMIHRDFPGGLEDMQEYVMEVVDGIKDHLVRDPNDPNDKKWEYTYHQRLFNYDVIQTLPAGQGADGNWYPAEPVKKTYNQIEMVCEKLAQTPYTRRAQAVTWKVWEDNTCYDPACLQSIWCRCVEDEGILWLNTNVRMRSNDSYKAAMMNIFAFAMLQKYMAERISQLSKREVRIGRYCHLADSYHIYGSYFKEFESRFLKNYKERTFEDRTFRYEDVKPIMDEAIPMIREKMKTFAK